MASEGSQILDKYSVSGEDSNKSAVSIRRQMSDIKPDWRTRSQTQQFATALELLDVDAPAMKNMLILRGNLSLLQACIDSLSSEEKVHWTLTLFYDMLREDSSSYGIFEEAMDKQIKIYEPLMQVLETSKSRGCEKDTYVADKAAWMLSALAGHLSSGFDNRQVEALVMIVTDSRSRVCSDLGALEALSNVLKNDKFRRFAWGLPGVPDRVFGVQASAASPVLYKSVFAMWMLTFDEEMIGELRSHHAVRHVKNILGVCRVERVVRMCIIVLRNVLSNSQLSEEIVEANILDTVQNLEFEKWRDAELYDDIRDISAQIAQKVQEMSNFARYETELRSGTLDWGFVHTSKFWAENVMKFDQDDFKALKSLARLLLDPQTDATSLAVACHDVGEFVTLHPLGKKKVAQMHIKERVMELMGSVGDEKRELRREALLCCQKIMLNKWQDMEKAK
jgi:V-type H+-transporting ATPase subunit H